MSQQPTKQQEAIINAITSNVAVSAGAGSGKTQVLIGRFIHILEESLAKGPDANGKYALNVDQIVAITFTKKAAAEMRGRLRKALNGKLDALQLAVDRGEMPQAAGKEEARFWRQQLERLPRTHISTIHGLCSFLLRENPREANLDPQFTLGEEFQMDQFVQNCLQQYIRQALRKQNPDIEAMMNIYGLNGFVEQINLLLPQLSEIQASGDLVAHYKNYIDEEKAMKADLCDLLEELAVHRTNYNNPKTYQANLANLEQHLDEVKAAIMQEQADFAQMRAIFDKMQNRGDFKPIYGDIKSFASAIEGRCYDKLALPIVEHWQNVLQGLYAYVQAEKQAVDLLTFDDLENMAIDLLKNYPEVREHYHKRFAHIMVDEFQDTNNKQRKLVYLLCGNYEDKLEGNKLFVVGDPKQSIYRFRGADVGVFHRVKNEIAATKGQCLSMDKNFRSRETILQTVNEIFEPLMGTDASQEVYFKALDADLPRMAGGVQPELYVAEYAKDDKSTKNIREAELVAAKILELHNQGTPLGAMTILLRYMTRCDVLLPILQEYNIPFVLHSGRGFYEEQEVIDLINLFTAIHNKHRSLELTGVLRSPYFGLDDETITSLFLASEDKSGLWDTLQNYDVALLKSQQQPLVMRARKLLASLRQEALTTDLLKLWDKAWKLLAIPAVLSQQVLGEAKLANAEKLRNLAQDFEEKQQGTLASWLEYVQNLRASGSQETSATVEAEDAVQIMTFHASKGLQFPVVLLPFLESSEMADKDSLVFLPPVATHPDVPWGLGVKVLADGKLVNSGMMELLRATDRHFAYEERMRLLYVAATRAEQQLYFFASAEEGKNPATVDYREKNWFVQLMSVMQDNGSFKRGDSAALLSNLQPMALLQAGAIDVQSPMLQPMANYDQLGVSYFSASALQTYAHCPRAYFYSYGLGLPAVEVEQEPKANLDGKLAAKTIGLIVHSTLEYYTKDAYDEAELERCYKLALKEHVRGVRQGTEPAWEMLVKYLNSSLLPKLSQAKKEQALSFYEQGFQFEGFIDCMEPNGDGTWKVIDYKTGAVPADANNKNAGYMYQLALYRLAVEKQFRLKVSKCELHYLQDLVTVGLEDDAEYEKYLAEALAQCREISTKPCEENAFPCAVGKQCEYCPYSYMCKQK